MIKTLTTKQGAELFMKPVDRRLYPAYFKQIKNPMDLGKVTKMIGARPCSYATVQEFAAAVRLTFDNCIRVSQPPLGSVDGLVTQFRCRSTTARPLRSERTPAASTRSSSACWRTGW